MATDLAVDLIIYNQPTNLYQPCEYRNQQLLFKRQISWQD
jgi:hypothetical protein